MTEGMRVVEEGIGPNDRIIVRGLQRVKPGKKVEPKFEEAPKTAANVASPVDGEAKNPAAKSPPNG